MGDVRAVVTSEVAATLRSLMLVDSAGERLVFRACVSAEGIVVVGSENDLDGLLGYVAAEANHEKDRRRQKRLDAAFQALSEVLEQTAPS